MHESVPFGGEALAFGGLRPHHLGEALDTGLGFVEIAHDASGGTPELVELGLVSRSLGDRRVVALHALTQLGLEVLDLLLERFGLSLLLVELGQRCVAHVLGLGETNLEALLLVLQRPGRGFRRCDSGFGDGRAFDRCPELIAVP